MEQINLDTDKYFKFEKENIPTLEEIKNKLNSAISVYAVKVGKENTQKLLKILKE